MAKSKTNNKRRMRSLKKFLKGGDCQVDGTGCEEEQHPPSEQSKTPPEQVITDPLKKEINDVIAELKNSYTLNETTVKLDDIKNELTNCLEVNSTNCKFTLSHEGVLMDAMESLANYEETVADILYSKINGLYSTVNTEIKKRADALKSPEQIQQEHRKQDEYNEMYNNASAEDRARENGFIGGRRKRNVKKSQKKQQTRKQSKKNKKTKRRKH